MNDDACTYSLTFEQRDGYTYSCVSAPAIDRRSAIKYLREVAAHCTAANSSRLMLVRDIPVMLPDADLFFTTKDFLSMIGSTRVAFVNPHVKIEKEMEFAIMIGTNRGANYQLFDNAASAEAWLLT